MKPTINRPVVTRIRPAVKIADRPTRTHPVIRRSAPPARVEPRRCAARIELPEFAPNPYVDYARVLTADGGIAITYKDLDVRFRQTIRRVAVWSFLTWVEWIMLFHFSPGTPAQNYACLAVFAILNWVFFCGPVEIARTIEIRPDCMIIDGSDIFWLRFMENGWPAFRTDDTGEGNRLLSGVYGTRYVDYLIVRRFDPLDRTPEVLAAHLQHAMQQLWTRYN